METTNNMSIKLSSDNYLQWKLFIQGSLRSKEVWKVVSGESTRPLPIDENEQSTATPTQLNRRKQEIGRAHV